MTHLAVEPVHQPSAATPSHDPHASPGPTPGSTRAPVAPVPLPVIRRDMDGPTMKSTYNCENATVLKSKALNTLFETSSVAVLDLLDKAPGGGPSPSQRSCGVRELGEFLIAGGEAEVVERWGILGRINAKLSKKYVQVLTGPAQAATADLRLWVSAVDAHPADYWGALSTRRVIKCDQMLEKIRAVATISAPVMSAITTHGNPHNPHLGLAAAMFADLFAIYPPDAKLARSGLAWGATPDKSADENKRSHVRKHFINEGKTVITPDPDEHWEWMTRTGVKFTRAEVEGILGAKVSEPGIFAAGSETVETKAEARKFFRTFLPTNEAVAEALLAKYGDRYLDAVVAAAGSMSKIFVTVLGPSILLFGQSGEIFIAGRWQPADKKFTISSGYINPKDKWDENQVFKIWSLTDG